MNPVREALRQVIEGHDFNAPRSLLRISAERACQRKPNAPYSIAENVAHAVQWQRLWLARIKGERKPEIVDWPKVDPEQWPEIREEFCAGLEEAMHLAETATDDQSAALLQIAVHGAYHVGQWNLLKRL